MALSVYFPIVFALLAVKPSPTASQYRIVGGSTASVSSLPYIVYLQRDGQLHCGGSLVAAQFVVTAGHCIYQVAPSSLTVVAGTSTEGNRSGVSSGVSKTMLPSNYNRSTRNMDIGVIKLKSALAGPNIRPIGLCNSRLRAGNSIRVAGWGRVSEKGNYSTQLRSMTVPLISRQKCSRQYRSAETLTSSMFCAQSRGKDACSGDSGGPAVYKGQLCGVVSWGYGCARPQYAGVYTSVNRAKAFIRRAMKT